MAAAEDAEDEAPDDSVSEPVAAGDVWPNPNCPERLGMDTGAAVLDTMLQQFGCLYQTTCVSRNDGSGESSCWLGVRRFL